MKNSLKTEVTAALKRKSNIARFTITGFLFIIINSLGYFKRAIFLMEGKVCFILFQGQYSLFHLRENLIWDLNRLYGLKRIKDLDSLSLSL